MGPLVLKHSPSVQFFSGRNRRAIGRGMLAEHTLIFSAGLVSISFAFPDAKGVDFKKEQDFEDLGHGAGWGATIEEWTCWRIKQDYCTKALLDMDSYWEDRWSWCTESFKDQRLDEIRVCPEELWRYADNDVKDNAGIFNAIFCGLACPSAK